MASPLQAGDPLVGHGATWGVSLNALVDLNGRTNPSLILASVLLRIPAGAKQ